MIERCSQDDTLATYFYWYLVVAIKSLNDPLRKSIYTNTLKQFSLCLMQVLIRFHLFKLLRNQMKLERGEEC